MSDPRNAAHPNPDSMIPWQGRPTHAVVDLDAVAANVRAILDHVGHGVRVAPAVKANAYGHGAVPVAAQALAAGASLLCVACVDEGRQLRSAGIAAPILVMGYLQPSEIDSAVQSGLTLTINDAEQVEAAATASESRGAKTRIHLKVDSGMNRYGSDVETLLRLAKLAGSKASLEMEGLYTHFACADEADKSSAYRQFETYQEARTKLRSAGFEFALYHVANSAAILDMPDTHLDMVRPGIATYGLYPSAEVSRLPGLAPALALKSQVARVHELRPGDGVSYGYTYIARKPTRVALVPIGYADGYHRSLSNKAFVLINGRKARVAGRVCMDQLVVDIGDLDGVAVGDEVVLIGRQGSECISADEVAGLAGTINYEVTTSLSTRVPRLYLRAGRPVGYSDLNSAAGLCLP
ncbi:MAG: alanine racemase [Chloroflexi bacterium]|nr:alanine racemase [Chloroflexota bacterium]